MLEDRQDSGAVPDASTINTLGVIMPDDENKKIVEVKNEPNSFELMLRVLGNEFIGIRLASTNASGKMILWAILLLFFTFMIMEVFGFNQYFTGIDYYE